jgi:hypothetical protein
MASFSFTDCDLTINSVDMSGFATSVTLKIEVDDNENTPFGNTFKTRIAGLKDWSVDIDFNSDFGASAVDATIWPLLGTTTTVTIKPTSSAIGSTNPSFSGSVLVTEYTPLDGGVGDLASVSVSWPGSGTLTRATS